MFKIGRATEWTEGRYTGLKPAYIETRLNIRLYRRPAPSGFPERLWSSCFDETHRVVGLLYAGNQVTGASYMLSVTEMFEDIKALTWAKAVRCVLLLES